MKLVVTIMRPDAVEASDAGQVKKLVQQQFPNATVLSVKKID